MFHKSGIKPNSAVRNAARLMTPAYSGFGNCSAAQSITYSLLGECTPRRVRGAYMMVMTATLMTTSCIYSGRY
ncbi:hypothetical protein EVAR_40232_1 [Eumeta japonica]|uniref:Uncharacterized protein n=1 Tax=Eumeta variegata TaxID=151549 RepID=A0A4C1X7T2_EUMVA|nr:hypothetical protein EVAR_40232_1 [Eumeta japonica]